jgi:hypothetical protein
MTKHMVAAVLAVLVLAGLGFAADDKDTDKVEFKIYGPYFEKNTSKLKGDSSYLVLSEQKPFDDVFGSGFTSAKKPVLIPKDVFEKNLVVAVIKRGMSVTTYEVEKATLKDGTLTLTYKTTAKGGGGTAKFSSPLVISVPKKDVKSVEFVENGKKVETVKVGK